MTARSTVHDAAAAERVAVPSRGWKALAVSAAGAVLVSFNSTATNIAFDGPDPIVSGVGPEHRLVDIVGVLHRTRRLRGSRWLADRFLLTYVGDWKTASLHEEFRWSRSTRDSPVARDLMGLRRVPPDRLNAEIAQQLCGRRRA